MTVSQGPVMPDVDTLIVHANGILEVINQVFAAESQPLPARQYITAGQQGDVAHDCEQLTISLAQVYSGSPGAQAQIPTKCNDPSSAVMIVELVRCVPGLEDSNTRRQPVVPTMAELNASGEQQMRDAWLLMRAANQFADEQNFLGIIADVTYTPPLGKYQAAVMTIIAGVV